MRIINILGILMGTFFLGRSLLLVRAKREDLPSLLIWITIGVGLLVASVVPSVFDWVIDVLGMETRAYAMFLASFFVAYLLLFRLYRVQRERSIEISRLNEELALVRGLLEELQKRD